MPAGEQQAVRGECGLRDVPTPTSVRHFYRDREAESHMQRVLQREGSNVDRKEVHEAGRLFGGLVLQVDSPVHRSFSDDFFVYTFASEVSTQTSVTSLCMYRCVSSFSLYIHV